jgi:hypothetical protein
MNSIINLGYISNHWIDKMKKVIVVAILPFLAGCASVKPNLITTEYKIVKAPDALYNCPTVTSFPKAATLTDQQVGALLIKLQNNNTTCKNSMEAIRQFYNDADKLVTPAK